jgi:Lectin C-type domain
VTARLKSFGLLLAVACGYHDTPVATYRARLPDLVEGGMAAGGATSASAGGDAGAPALAAPPCMQTYPLIPDGLTSHYRTEMTGQPWVIAERDCEAEGAHLAVVDDDAENAWLASIAALALADNKSTHQLAWLGASDQASEGNFEWVTGAPVGAPRWAAMEPNSMRSIEDCVEIRASGEWNDDRCNAPLIYICECDALLSAATWCDTDTPATCGDCSTSCAAGQSCSSQQCM